MFISCEDLKKIILKEEKHKLYGVSKNGDILVWNIC